MKFRFIPAILASFVFLTVQSTTWRCTFYGWKEVAISNGPRYHQSYEDVRYEEHTDIETDAQGITLHHYFGRISFGNRMAQPKIAFEPVEAIKAYYTTHPNAMRDDTTLVNDIAPGTCVLVK